MGYFFTTLARFFEGAIVSVGAHLTISLGGIFLFGLPTMYALGAYAFVVCQKFGLGSGLSFLITLGLVLLVSLVFILAYWKLSNESLAIFTLISVLAFDAVVKSWDSVTGGVLGIAGVARPSALQTLGQLVFWEGALIVIILTLEYFFLKTKFGRALLGMRENIPLVQSLGISSKKLGAAMILVASILAALAGLLTVWRIQFLDPSIAGMVVLIQVVTVGILAVKPKVSWLIGAALFVTLVPEILRLFDLPSTMVGNLRVLLYAVILIVALRSLKGWLAPKRFV
ncbi:MAG: hypothetical protein NTV81_04650 [Candidatus Komeilibacteria bacterium]|nr:hypothetical protein [Candidatus Komeilibacteria bacterium]